MFQVNNGYFMLTVKTVFFIYVMSICCDLNGFCIVIRCVFVLLFHC